MTTFRIEALEASRSLPLPDWDADFSNLDLARLSYDHASADGQNPRGGTTGTAAVQAFDRLKRNIADAELKDDLLESPGAAASLGARQDAETLYDAMRRDLQHQGVVFVDMATALREYPDVVRQYIGTAVPLDENTFAALNGAIWSGGSFIHVPEGVEVTVPLQSDFRVNPWGSGPFERTLIIAEPGSSVQYIEGCAAPIYVGDILRSTVVEIVIKEDAKVRYTTLQNWSSNVYNVAMRRALVDRNGVMEWIDGILGSKLSRTTPSIFLRGAGARGDIFTVAYSGREEDQGVGGEIKHVAASTSGAIVSRSVSVDGGRIVNDHRTSDSAVERQADVETDVRSEIMHVLSGARVDHLNDEGDHFSTDNIGVDEAQLFVLMSRGLPESEATRMMVTGFIEPVVGRLPMEYGIELSRLLQFRFDDALD